MRSGTFHVWATWCVGVLALAHGAAGCIIQGDRCSANQVAYTDQHALCLCAPDHVPDADGTGCVPCGENETAQQSRCVCRPGFGRVSESEACRPVEAQSACESDATCPAATPYCARKAAEPGYCTSTGCTANADCMAGWSCEAGASGRYCARPPSGLGSPCQSDADCASYDARYCDTLQTRTCLLSGCATGDAACPSEWACCDYSALLGSPLSICMTPDSLMQGSCPLGGAKVGP